MPRTILPALLLTATLLAPTRVEAQLAVKGGLSFASASQSAYLPDLKTKTGFAVGLSYGFGKGGILQFRPELFYVQKGGKLASDATFTLNELNVPALLQVNIPIPGIGPYVYAGPQAELQLTCTAFDTDCVDTKSLRWGGVAGVGVRLGSVLSVEGRYNWTLSEIADNIKSKPRTILLLAGLNF